MTTKQMLYTVKNVSWNGTRTMTIADILYNDDFCEAFGISPWCVREGFAVSSDSIDPKERIATLEERLTEENVGRQKVFVLVGSWQYEGDQLVGVFDSNEAVDKFLKTPEGQKAVANYDSYHVYEEYVNAPEV